MATNDTPATTSVAIVPRQGEMVKYYDDAIVKERDLMAKAGCQFYKLDPKEAAKFTQLAYDAWWEFMMTKVPDLVPNLKKMTGN